MIPSPTKLTVALLFCASLAFAQGDPAERFDRGVRLASEGDHRGALAEFRAAYDATRNPEVLFNIAASHERLNEYAEAEEVLGRYERLSPPSAFARHRAEVVAAQQRLRERVGVLRVQTPLRELSCTLDGAARTRAELVGGVRASMGRRLLRCDAEGYERFERSVELGGEETIEVEVSPARRRAALQVVSALAGAELRIDGALIGRTPFDAPVSVSEGRHSVELSHPGYESARAELDVGADGARFEPRMRWREPVPEEEAAWLEVRASEPGSVATLDGRRHAGDGSVAVPPGSHRLRVEREGFLAVERDLILTLGGRARESLQLAPTPAFRDSYLRGARAARTRWVALIASGLAATVGGAVWFGLTLPGFLDANQRSEENARLFNACGTAVCPLTAPQYGAMRDAAAREADALQPQVIVAGALLGVGVTALVVGAVLAADAPSPQRFDAPSSWHFSASLSGLRLDF